MKPLLPERLASPPWIEHASGNHEEGKRPARPLPATPDRQNLARTLLSGSTHLRRIAVITLSDVAKPNQSSESVEPLNNIATFTFTQSAESIVTVDVYLDDDQGETHQHILHEVGASVTQGAIISKRILTSGVTRLRKVIELGIPVPTTYDDCEQIRMVCAAALSQRITIDRITVQDQPEFTEGYREVSAPKNPERVTALFVTSIHLMPLLKPTFGTLEVSTPKDLSVILCSVIPKIPSFVQPVDIIKLDIERIGTESVKTVKTLYSGKSSEKTQRIKSIYEPNGTVTQIHRS